MKYATEVIDLLAAYPGREFKMAHIINFIKPDARGTSRYRVHKGVLRVLRSLEENGSIDVAPATAAGSGAQYSWKVRHDVLANRDRNRDNIARDFAP